ncbi:hypothetical protein HYQ46_004348 [Verticillium longisporum]|nr:hypothetical protein HYQ46_004348 [Verticillium longisporum]
MPGYTSLDMDDVHTPSSVCLHGRQTITRSRTTTGCNPGFMDRTPGSRTSTRDEDHRTSLQRNTELEPNYMLLAGSLERLPRGVSHETRRSRRRIKDYSIPRTLDLLIVLYHAHEMDLTGYVFIACPWNNALGLRIVSPETMAHPGAPLDVRLTTLNIYVDDTFTKTSEAPLGYSIPFTPDNDWGHKAFY